MTDPLPDWLKQTPNLESLHNLPNVPWGGYNPQNVPLPSLPDLFEFVGKFLEKFLEQVVMAVVGFFIPGVSSFEQLQEWAQNLGAQITSFIYNTAGINLASWDDFVASLADGKGIDLPLLKAALDGLSAIFGGLDLTDLPTPAEVWQQVINTIMLPLNLLLGPGSPLNAAKLFGWIPHIDLGSIGHFTPNLLTEWDFAAAITIDPNTGYTWDGLNGRTNPGCASVLPDGEDYVLVGQKIPVSEGQELEIGTYAYHAGVGAGANPISLELLTFGSAGSTTADSTEPIATRVSAATDSTDWTASLSGTYTVPDGVTHIAVQLHVTPAALAGVVKFDDVWVKKVQKMPIPFVDQLPEDLQQKAERILGIIDRIFNGWANLGQMIDSDNPVESVLDAITGLLGIGLNAQSNVSSVEARVRALESSASTIVEDFARASASSLGSNYTVRNVSGGGGGSIGLDGRGNGVWIPSGAGNRTQYARRNDMTVPSNGFVFRMVISSNPQSYIFDDAYTYFLARMNETASTLVRLRLGFGTAQLQAVVSDAVTNLGSAASITTSMAGKTLEWQGGDAGNTNLRHFTVKLDNAPIIDVTDVGNVSAVGDAFRSVGVGMETGNRLVFFQNIPCGCAFYSVSEMT